MRSRRLVHVSAANLKHESLSAREASDKAVCSGPKSESEPLKCSGPFSRGPTEWSISCISKLELTQSAFIKARWFPPASWCRVINHWLILGKKKDASSMLLSVFCFGRQSRNWPLTHGAQCVRPWCGKGGRPGKEKRREKCRLWLNLTQPFPVHRARAALRSPYMVKVFAWRETLGLWIRTRIEIPL